MSMYGDCCLVAAAKEAAYHAKTNGADGVTRIAIIGALRHLLKPSKAMREALKNSAWTEGRLNMWRAGIEAAIKELER